MNVLHCRAPGNDAPASTLVVLLPGAYNRATDFQRHGFVAAVERRGLALDLAPLDVSLAHYSGGQAIPMLCDATGDARRRGYRAIWLAGVSLGAMTAMAFAALHPAAVDGLCLIAPYPGSRPLRSEIERAGGLAAWVPGVPDARDAERAAWCWLQRRGADPVPAWMLFGEQDRFADGQRAMAAALPQECVVATRGHHDWPTWLTHWKWFLDRAGLAVAAPSVRERPEP